ncbi:2854_t:CDS:2 [Cetraspora pellucida]|uniref:2854_t:CDS:1 n=1 Tax=Cetraspora pellucida TaxID=1433469 RepID=A0A9N9DY48_9GLOM|nr:2854_t:CDS:2 [Cetraspora pellucida]
MDGRQSRNAGRTNRPASDIFKEEDNIIAELVTPEKLDEDDNSMKYLCIVLDTEYDTSKIPFQYQLSLRHLYAINNRYDYVISSLPDSEYIQKLNLTARDGDQNSNNISSTKSNKTKQIELGLLISRSMRILTPGYYEAQEDRYSQNGTIYRVITATASYTNLFYTAWYPPITIEFFTNPNESAYKVTNYQDLILCKYQFTWTSIPNGYVNRKCKDDSKFLAISYVNGSSLFGFTFYSLDEMNIYAHATAPDLADQDFFFRRYWWKSRGILEISSCEQNKFIRKKVLKLGNIANF